MADIFCGLCGEPWDSYGITYAIGEGDMTREEITRFRKGEGCPSCEFGTTCTECHGSKIENNSCGECFGRGTIMARILQRNVGVSSWAYGWLPHLKYLTNPKFLTEWRSYETGDGWAYEAKCVCPKCEGKGEPCHDCNGDGKFHRHDDQTWERGLTSLLDASDEEPIGLIDDYAKGGLE